MSTEIDGELRAAFLPWHSDLVYVDEINHGPASSRPVTLPKNDGHDRLSSTRSRAYRPGWPRAPLPNASRISASSIAMSSMLRRAKYGWGAAKVP